MAKEKLDIKIGSPKEVVWTRVLDNSRQALENSEVELEIQKAIIELAQKKIKEEKA